MSTMRPGLTMVFSLGLLSACAREERAFRTAPAGSDVAQQTLPAMLHAGPQGPIVPTSRVMASPGAPGPDDAEHQAYAIAEGRRLFNAFNCVGCHSNGGGGMGPALMDDVWIYGASPEQIYADLVNGRPNGMPSFRGRLTDDQIWRLAAYVRSMSGLVDSNTAPGRADQMQGAPPPSSARPDRPNPEGPK